MPKSNPYSKNPYSNNPYPNNRNHPHLPRNSDIWYPYPQSIYTIDWDTYRDAYRDTIYRGAKVYREAYRDLYGADINLLDADELQP
jgi:hypothetical protein